MSLWHLSPSEFWAMTVPEWWAAWRWHLAAERARAGVRGPMTADERREAAEWAARFPDSYVAGEDPFGGKPQ